MRVSEDKYEWPEVITMSAAELAKVSGVTEGTIRSCISLRQSGKVKYSRYVRVEIDDE